jgi:hypothetical protein
MKRRALVFLLAFILPVTAFARGGHSSSRSHSSYRSHRSSYRTGRTAHVPHSSYRQHRRASSHSRPSGSHTPRRTAPHPGTGGRSTGTTSTRRANLATCLSGKRSPNCNYSLLTSTELKRVRAAEKRESPTASAQGAPETTPATSQHAAGHGYINSQGERVPSPTWTKNGKAPAGASARCLDGSYSFSRHHQGTCSHHGGVAQWL